MSESHLRTISHALVLIAIMLGLIAAALWLRMGTPSGSDAQAQTTNRASAAQSEGGVPDAGKQRLNMVEQLDMLNRHVADLEKGLREGAFVVQTIEAKPSAKAGQKAAE